MGGFFRNDIINTKTTAFVFLLILPCGRILLLGSPALHYAGTDRLQMVGVGSLYLDSPLVEVALSFSAALCSIKEEAGRRKKNAIESECS